MEPSALYTVLQNLQKPQPLRNLREPLGDLTVIIHRPSGNKSVKVRGLAPFHTVEDIQRALWLQQEKPDDLYPKFCHLAYERDDEMIPALYTCLIVEDGDVVPVQIDEAMATVQARNYQNAFVDEDGNKLPVNPNPRGRASIDDVFLTPMGGVPTLHAYPLQGLLSAFSGPKPMSAKDWYGLFYPYFPDLEMNETGVMSPAETEIAGHLAEFMTAKLAQVAMLDSLRTAVNLREFTTTGVRFIGLQWAKREREEYFGGLDSLFFSAAVVWHDERLVTGVISTAKRLDVLDQLRDATFGKSRRTLHSMSQNEMIMEALERNGFPEGRLKKPRRGSRSLRVSRGSRSLRVSRA